MAVGQPVTISVNGYPGVSFPGKITLLAPVASSTSHSFQAQVTPQPPDPRLKPGMFANVTITTESVPDAIAVPRSAIVQQNNQNVVFTVQNGKAQAVPVQIGVMTPDWAQVVSGIKPGEGIVTVGQTTLLPGQPVRVVQGTAPSNGRAASATPGARSQAGGAVTPATPAPGQAGAAPTTAAAGQ